MYIDLLFLTLLLAFAIVGYIRGFINQVISLLMFLTILFFAKPLADWLKYESGWKWFHRGPELINWAIASIFFVLLWIGIGQIVLLIKKAPGLTPIDRWLGVTLGFFKGIVVLLVIGAVYQTMPDENRSQFEDLDADAKKSVFMSMSHSLMGWKGISSFDSLSEINRRLKPQEITEEVIETLDLEIDAPPKTSSRKSPWSDD